HARAALQVELPALWMRFQPHANRQRRNRGQPDDHSSRVRRQRSRANLPNVRDDAATGYAVAARATRALPQPDPPVTASRPWRSSAAKASADRRSAAAATFCRKCSGFDVPGMGSMTLARLSVQASATWLGVAWSRSATFVSTEPGPASAPEASGNQG